MNLEADAAFGVAFEDLFVGEVGDGLAVDPCFDVGSVGDDAEVVPLAIFHELVWDEEVLWSKPAATGGFSVDVAGLGSFWSTGFAFDLGAEDTAAVFIFVFVLTARANHDAGVEVVVDLSLELELEIVVEFVGAEEGVWAAFFGGADDGVAFDGVFRFAAHDGPTAEVVSVEE